MCCISRTQCVHPCWLFQLQVTFSSQDITVLQQRHVLEDKQIRRCRLELRTAVPPEPPSYAAKPRPLTWAQRCLLRLIW